MNKISFYGILLALLFPACLLGQVASLRSKMQLVVTGRQAVIGCYIAGWNADDTISINGDKHFPMQSVFKFPLAMAILNAVDKGKLQLQQEVFIPDSLLRAPTWSPIRDQYPKGNISLSLEKILGYTVTQSDNIGCDMLLGLIGGPKGLEAYIHEIGIYPIAISVTEADMHKTWDAQFNNWVTPKAMDALLRKFYTGEVLSKSSHDLLWKMMVATNTGTDRIKGQLPAGTTVAHKTGSSGTNKEGLTAAINDGGIVTLPNGRRFTISVFVSNSKESDTTNAGIIAALSKIAWDYFAADVSR
jgi:beta-lactamase class A